VGDFVAGIFPSEPLLPIEAPRECDLPPVRGHLSG